MSPNLSKDLIHLKTESVRRCLDRVAEKIPDTRRELERDFDAQDIVAVNLERAVQSCVDIAAHLLSTRRARAPSSMTEAFTELASEKIISARVADRMAKAVGFRNVMVHEYTAVDWGIVFKVATRHLKDFKDFLREVNRWIEK